MAQTLDPEQLTGDVLRLGVIASVDHANATCTVESGDVVTGELPWISPRAGSVCVWSPPTVGEQCLLLSPEGDIENGVVIVGLYCDAFPSPSANPDLVHLEFRDGAVIAYDQAGHALTVTLPAGGTAYVDAPGGLTLNCDVTVNGKLTASTDVIGGGISLKDHKHSGVQAGAAQTGAPV
ncbi:phage baseplate assembly protein V [Novosphingobium mathurense]|uniref:Phage baseplate assembly protein V n=1 Tax=Novosphingobium mathurense TaxID=428990 RepID=A0A1U6IN99_9SPHN|nr:phage baseplate assembly protein V [Novosphingobium mathurense]SLK09511.1 phage baseplate assembly protein V [Novosphingobium mathurense]